MRWESPSPNEWGENQPRSELRNFSSSYQPYAWYHQSNAWFLPLRVRYSLSTHSFFEFLFFWGLLVASNDLLVIKPKYLLRDHTYNSYRIQTPLLWNRWGLYFSYLFAAAWQCLWNLLGCSLWSECFCPLAPKFSCLNSNPQSDGLRGLEETIRSCGPGFPEGISALPLCCSPCEDVEGTQPYAHQGADPQQTQLCWGQNCEK